MLRTSILTPLLATLVSMLGCDQEQAPKPQSPAISTQAAKPAPTLASSSAAPVEPMLAFVAPASKPAQDKPRAAQPVQADPSELRPATASESAQTPVPAFVPAMADPTVDGPLVCPDGAEVYRSERAVHCAFREARWGKGRHGPSLSFHRNGALASQDRYDNGKGVGGRHQFDEHGQLTAYWEVEGDDNHGLSVLNHANGKRSSEAMYVHGKLHGTRKLWNELGELMSMEVYANGELVSEQLFAYTLIEMTPEQLEASQRELAKLLAEQKGLVEGLE